MTQTTTAKTTTQSAPLESFLTKLRTRKIVAGTAGKNVLDFGCGRSLNTLRALKGVAATRTGFDPCFYGEAVDEIDGIRVVGALQNLHAPQLFDCVTALACFEHLEPEEFIGALKALAKITTPDARILGTVPRPPAKPVLEFLAYRCHLIDASQILDHKVYYDRELLRQTVARGGWVLSHYEKFQIGFNSYFELRKA